MNFYQTIKNIEEMLEKETDPHKREQYRNVIRTTIINLRDKGELT